MRALLCKEYGPPETLVVEEVPAPEPGPGQLRIRVEAAGVNFPDGLIIENKYQFKPPLPFSPGGEVAGTVAAVGPEVEGFAVGDRVMAGTLHGGFAEECLADADRTVKLPPEFDLKVAAAIGLVYGTSYHALFDRGGMTEADTVLVLGAAGGVGLAAVELAHAIGATVIAAASTDEKLAVCREHGADHLINYARDDLRARLKEVAPDGPTIVYDPVGGELTEKAFRSIAMRGRHLVVGFASGEIPKIPMNLPLLKFASLVGVFWGDYARREPEANLRDMNTLMDWIRQGRLKPVISATYPLAEGGAAIRHISERKAIGKLVVEPQR
ncbi:MAG TPA: NADPH:quinone oxidoreductase family protein [Paracoccaceae bacterium]|nr:NADPH:quinone oxidoreductase family protein [Paracoccaceae bacterium]